MTLLQLKYFCKLAHVLHYTRTAEQLHISQPSLSYAISEMEKELGVKLFQREKQKVMLTVYGQQLLPYVDRALALLDDGQASLQKMIDDAPKVIRLGYFQSISHSVVPLMIDGFYKCNPAFRAVFQFTEASSMEIMRLVQNGGLDLGFSFTRPDWAESILVTHQSLRLAVPIDHPLSKRESVTFLDFAYEPQIMLNKNNSLRHNEDQAFEHYGIIPRIAFEVRECNAALQYVGLGFGVSVLPQIPVMNTEKVKYVPISDHDECFYRNIYLTWNKTKPLPSAAQQLKDYVETHTPLADIV